MALTLTEAQQVLHQLGVPRLSEEEMRAEITTHFALSQLDLMEKIGHEVHIARQKQNYIGVVDEFRGICRKVVDFAHQNWNEFYALRDYEDEDFLECWGWVAEASNDVLNGAMNVDEDDDECFFAWQEGMTIPPPDLHKLGSGRGACKSGITYIRTPILNTRSLEFFGVYDGGGEPASR